MQNIDRAVEQYRLRFYLLNAFVQQQVLDGRASLICQSAVAKVQARPDVDKNQKVSASVHPAGVAQALADGVFRDHVSMEEYVKLVLSPENIPVCATNNLPRKFEEAAVQLWKVIR